MKTFNQFLNERMDDLSQIKSILDRVAAAGKEGSESGKPYDKYAVDTALKSAGFDIQHLGAGFFGRVISGKGGRELVLKIAQDETYYHFAEQVLKHKLWERNPYFPVIYYVNQYKTGLYRPQCFVLLESLQMDEAKFRAAQKRIYDSKEGEFIGYQLAASSEYFMGIVAEQYHQIITTGNALNLHSDDYPMLRKCMEMFFTLMRADLGQFDEFLKMIYKMFPNERRGVLDFKPGNVGYRGAQMVFFDPVAVSEGKHGSMGGA